MINKFKKVGISTTLMLSILMSVTLVSSCKKTESTIVAPEKPADSNSVSNEKLVKFLSITLGVGKEEVIFNEKCNEFNVRGHKFNRPELETRYLSANVYKATYGE